MTQGFSNKRSAIRLAIRSSRLLGIAFTLIGLLILLLSALPSFAAPGRRMPRFLLVAVASVYLVPGVLYLFCAIFMGSRRPWAFITTIVVSALSGLIAVAFCVRALMALSLIVGLIGLLWVAALAQLILHAYKGLNELRLGPDLFARGFEPLPVMPVSANE